MDAGQLNHLLTLEQPVETSDGTGGVTIVWQEVAELWAALEPVSASMRDEAWQSHETVSHRVWLRHRADIASGWRFRKQGRIFRIITIHDPDETGRYLVCRTEEIGR